MRIVLGALGFALVAACQADETLRAYGAGDQLWRLVELDGAAFDAQADIRFEKDGQVTGRAPCNRFFAKQTAPYPWFEVGPIGATKVACPKLSQERAFFAALSAMTLAEVSGGTLVLSTPEGREMVFTSAAE